MLQQSRQPGNDPFIHALPLSPPGPRGGSPLPERLLRALEHLSGHDLGGVRVHRDSALPARMGARAFAYGEDIHLSPGAEDALAHEAWHVVQQREGRVRPTGRLGGFPLNDDPWLEREAEVMGRRAERLSTSPTPGGIRRVPILSGPDTHPVVQRVVTVDKDIILTAKAIRDKLNIWHGVTAQNTPHLQEVVDDIVRKKRTFMDLAALKDEVKRRSFGLRHLEAMEALRVRQEERIEDFMRANKIATRLELETVANEARKYSNSNAKGRQNWGRRKGPPPELTFIHWGAPVYIDPKKATGTVSSHKVFKWLTGQKIAPTEMNCWESVLYSGGWSAGGQRAALYSTDYAYWADQVSTVPDATFKAVKGNDKPEPSSITVPRFVKDIIDAPVEHHTKQGQLNEVPRIPANLQMHAGMIVVLNCGQHVALATGRTCALLTADGRQRYGSRAVGHEILELDGATCWIIKNTLEDAIGRGYSKEFHLGWLPECTQAQTLTYRKTQVQVAQTSFYA